MAYHATNPRAPARISSVRTLAGLGSAAWTETNSRTAGKDVAGELHPALEPVFFSIAEEKCGGPDELEGVEQTPWKDGRTV